MDSGQLSRPRFRAARRLDPALESRGASVALAKLDKHTWRAAPCRGPLTVTAEVYGWDLSVRGAHLDSTHGFFNGTCVFLRVLGREERECDVEILPPAGRRYARWRVATSLARKGARPLGFGGHAAADYDELIDHPVEMGDVRARVLHRGRRTARDRDHRPDRRRPRRVSRAI